MAERGSKRGRRAGAIELEGPVRLERDRLGEREVPADALWGIFTLRSLENLSFSSRPLGSQPIYVWALAAVKRAAARANREADADLSRPPQRACQQQVDGVATRYQHDDHGDRRQPKQHRVGGNIRRAVAKRNDWVKRRVAP